MILSGNLLSFTNLFRLASLLALFNWLNFFFLAGALMCFFKIMWVIFFEYVGVFCRDSFLALFLPVSSTIFLRLYLLSSGTFFMLMTWPSGLFSLWCCGSYTRSSQSTWELVWALVSSSQSEKMWGLLFRLISTKLTSSLSLIHLPSPLQSHSNPFLGSPLTALSFSAYVSLLTTEFFPCLNAILYICLLVGPLQGITFSLQSFSSALSLLCFSRTVFSSQHYQCFQVGTPSRSGQLHHHWLPLVLSETSYPPLWATLTHFALSSVHPISFFISDSTRLRITPRLSWSWRVFLFTPALSYCQEGFLCFPSLELIFLQRGAPFFYFRLLL